MTTGKTELIGCSIPLAFWGQGYYSSYRAYWAYIDILGFVWIMIQIFRESIAYWMIVIWVPGLVFIATKQNGHLLYVVSEYSLF